METSWPDRKGMATLRRVSLFKREIRTTLSTAALDILFDEAEVLSEGQRTGSGYFGSTMMTIDLTRAASAVRDECDATSARRVAELLEADRRVRSRARSLALTEAEERGGAKLSRFDVDLKVRVVGARIHVDMDVSGDFSSSSCVG